MWPRWSPKPPNSASTRSASRRRWCRSRSQAGTRGVRVAAVAGFPSGKHVPGSQGARGGAGRRIRCKRDRHGHRRRCRAGRRPRCGAVRHRGGACRCSRGGAQGDRGVGGAVEVRRTSARWQSVSRRRGRRRGLRQDLDRVSSRRRCVGACGRGDGRRPSAGGLGSRPAAASAPPPTQSRCWMPVPPGWACRAPERCSTASARADRRQMLAKQGSWPLPVGMLAFWVEKWLTTPVEVTCTLSAWIPNG